jgi:S1-C subfamily serine protease
MMVNNHRKIRIWTWVAVLALLTIACASTLPLGSLTPQQNTDNNIPVQEFQRATPTAFVVPPAVLDEQAVLVSLYGRVNPSVVNITNYVTRGGQTIGLGQGSGFVYDNEGHIITNAHVLQNADQLEVTFSDATIVRAELVGEDLNSDLAVIKVDSLPEGIIPIPLGDIQNLAVGQTVVAIGNPFGLEGTLTRGIISALGRSIPALTPFSIPQSIQTDAAINPGNSGGPLLNLQGEVIGVNAQIETGGTSQANSGVGFAIPVSIVKLVIPDIITEGKHTWSWFGVRGGNLNPALAEANKLTIVRGAYISEVVEGGPADKAGLRGSAETQTLDGRIVEVGGDVIIAIDGKQVNSFDDLLIYVALEGSPGQEVVLTILREGQEMELTLRLEERPVSLDV